MQEPCFSTLEKQRLRKGTMRPTERVELMLKGPLRLEQLEFSKRKLKASGPGP